jgi:Na+/serine symporter
MFAYAATKAPDALDTVMSKINANIINPAIEFAFIIALVIFLWGVFQFIANAGDSAKRQEGKDHMLWGIVGFLIMFGVFGIITILSNTLGVTGLTVNGKQQTFVPPPITQLQYPK